MSDYGIAILIIMGFWALGFGFGYIAGNANPPKGEIILTAFDPHKCKGLPNEKLGIGTQWKCNTCGSVWELQEIYDGIVPSRAWGRIKATPMSTKGKKK